MTPKTLKTIEKPLAGGKLTVTQFPVMHAIRVGGRVGKIVSPIIAGISQGLNLDDVVNGRLRQMLAEGEVSLSRAVPGALNAIAQHLDPETLASVCLELLGSAFWVDAGGKEKVELNTEAGIDMVLGGSIPDLFTALKTALEANDFFGLGAIGKLRGLGAPDPKTSPAA